MLWLLDAYYCLLLANILIRKWLKTMTLCLRSKFHTTNHGIQSINPRKYTMITILYMSYWFSHLLIQHIWISYTQMENWKTNKGDLLHYYIFQSSDDWRDWHNYHLTTKIKEKNCQFLGMIRSINYYMEIFLNKLTAQNQFW